MFFGGGGAEIFFGGGGHGGGGRRNIYRNGQYYQQGAGVQRQAQEERGAANQNPGIAMLQQIFPLLLILFMTGVLNFGGSSTSVAEPIYKFNYVSHYFPVQVMTTRLSKYYYVSEKTAYDLRLDPVLKKRVRLHYFLSL